MPNHITCALLTLTGLHGVKLGHNSEIGLGNGFFLARPSPFLLSARSREYLSDMAFREMESVECFLVLREQQPILKGLERDQSFDRFQNGLMALQVLKPVESIGFTFQGYETAEHTLFHERVYQRPPMKPGEWALMRGFDSSLISKVPKARTGIQTMMTGTVAEPKNMVSLLQLALEHFHPLISGLLCILGLEAKFDSKDRFDFKRKLTDLLGGSTPAFPDWNSPIYRPPSYTVEDIALDIYMLRNKIAHGVDLRKAAQDKSTPVDLLRRKALIPELPKRAYAAILSEAAMYLLCQAIQKTIGL